MDAFVLAFGTLGYEKCTDGLLEIGFQKVALFADARGVPTHASRQASNGGWMSKLGKCEDIRHEDVGGLEDSVYGRVAVILKRSVRPAL
jgi:hypothetical protein